LNSAPKKNTRLKGKKYEKLAEQFLIEKGFEILERNWQAGHQEIDLIGRDKNTIVFVEVKGSRTNQFGHPAEKVDSQKRRNLIKAAEKYIIDKNFSGYDFRFDLVTFLGEKLEYYCDAFWDGYS